MREPLMGLEIQCGEQTVLSDDDGFFFFETALEHLTLQVNNRVNLFKPLSVDVSKLAESQGVYLLDDW